MHKSNTDKYLIETVQAKDIQEINQHYDRQLKQRNGENKHPEALSSGFNKIEKYLGQLLILNEKANE